MFTKLEMGRLLSRKPLQSHGKIAPCSTVDGCLGSSARLWCGQLDFGQFDLAKICVFFVWVIKPKTNKKHKKTQKMTSIKKHLRNKPKIKKKHTRKTQNTRQQKNKKKNGTKMLSVFTKTRLMPVWGLIV